VTSGLASYFLDLKYNFDEKYLASFTGRLDGSSRFGKGRRYGFFPTLSAGWRISQERFMERFEFIDDLKLRGSYGFTGNEQIGNFKFLGTFSGSTYNGVSGLGPTNLENNDLQWELTREVNIGLDATLFNGRISANFDVYNNRTNRLLFDQPIPFTTGFGSVTGNIGEISNKGFGIAIKTSNTTGAIQWNTSFNFSKNVNKVVSLADTLPIFRGYEATPVARTNIVLPGHPLGTFWGLRYLGVDPGTGDAIYDDINGDGKINGDDGAVIGSAQPDFIAGMTNNVSYKSFDLSVILQCTYGNEILNLSNTSLLDGGQSLQNNQIRKALDRWQKPGDITDVPRYEQGNTYNNYHSSRFIEDGSFLRVKNVTLGYNVPNKWTSKYYISTARVYVSGTNLYTLTKYTGSDPEVSTLDGSTTAQGIDFFTLPQVRTIMVGLSIGF
jgi:TonB-linked SusC/RagA family outer membrane protein